jgi:hypothetical protein
MAERLTHIGIACECRELSSPGESDEDAAACDFLYVELSVTEPMVDAVRLFGSNGCIDASPHLKLAVRDVMTATNMQQASERLHALHAVVHA